MKYLLSVLALASALSVPAAVNAAEIVDSYVKGTYQHICIMHGDEKYCGNWNVVSSG